MTETRIVDGVLKRVLADGAEIDVCRCEHGCISNNLDFLFFTAGREFFVKARTLERTFVLTGIERIVAMNLCDKSLSTVFLDCITDCGKTVQFEVFVPKSEMYEIHCTDKIVGKDYDGQYYKFSNDGKSLVSVEQFIHRSRVDCFFVKDETRIRRRAEREGNDMSCGCHGKNGIVLSGNNSGSPYDQCTACAKKHINSALSLWKEFTYEQENRDYVSAQLRDAINHTQLDHTEFAHKCRNLAVAIEANKDLEFGNIGLELQSLLNEINTLFYEEHKDAKERLEQLKNKGK